MRLINLKLRNFKGIIHFVLDAGGNDVTVFGDNGTGKTTLADAFMWLLFDKDSTNRKDFEIKTLDQDGGPIHGLEHDVEATLDLGSGRQITLRKVFKEVWAKKRGSAQKQFTGHTTDHYIDGVPVKKSEYQAAVADIAPEDVFRLLTDPTYFNEHMHWQERRKLLLEVCGDVSDEDVIASEPELAPLRKILAGRSLDQHRKVVMARRAEINKELERIPVRIDEVTQGLPEVPEGASKYAIRAEIERLRGERQAKEAERARIEAGGEAAELQKRISEIEAEMLAVQSRAMAETERAVQEERARLDEIEDRLDDARRRLQRLDRQQADDRAEIERLKKDIEAKRRQWHEVNAQTYQGPSLAERLAAADTSGICPACGQSLPPDRVREAQERVKAAYEESVAQFNANKAAWLERISSEGKAMRERLDHLQAGIDLRTGEIEQAKQEVETLEGQAAEVRVLIDSLRAKAPDPTQDPEYRRLHEERQRIDAELAALRQGNAEALQRVAGEIRALDEQIQALERTLHEIETRERWLARIEELKDEERRLAAEYEDIEHQMHLMERFTRAKVSMLEDKINSKFQLARFKLFNVLVNGGIEESCEVTVNGVPYGSLNHGARIQVGLDIIETLGNHYGFHPPIFVDNAEAITYIQPTTAQQIRLVVSAQDKSLRVVVHEEKKSEV